MYCKKIRSTHTNYIHNIIILIRKKITASIIIMDKSNKTWNYDRDKKQKKMVMKFGGGGIGAVVLLGGVLATAALASACASRRKGRSSGKDRRTFHRNPPPEKDKMSEQDEANNDTVSPVSIENLTPGVNMNSVSDDGFVIVDEDFAHPEDKLPLESENHMPEDDQMEGDVSYDYSKEKENQEQVCVEEELKQEENIGIIEVDEERESGDEERESGLQIQIGEIVVDDEAKLIEKQEKCEEKQRNETRGKIEVGEENVTIPHEKNNENGNIYGITNEEAEFDEERESGLKEDIELIEVKLEKEEVEEFCSGDEELIMSEMKCVENDERESGLHTQIEEIAHEDQETWNDEKLVEKQKNCEEKQRNETRGLIEEREDNVTTPHENNKENGYLLHQTPDEITNDEAEFDAKKYVEKEVDISPESINKGIDKANGGTDLDTSKEEEEEEIVEESSLRSGDSSSESNSEVVWPAESAKPILIDYEYEVGEHNNQTIIEEKTFVDKYYIGETGMKKDRRTNLGRWRVAIATFSLLSSLSCSWFFDLSFANLCFVVFLTMLMSEFHRIATESSSARESHQAQN